MQSGVRQYLNLLLGVLAGCIVCQLNFKPITKDDYHCLNKNISTPEEKPRILCYLNTYPKNYEKKAIHAQNTWARKCDKHFFTSTVKHDKLSVMILNMTEPEVRKHLWVKMRKILRQLYLFADEYDYFFKADDDTYAVVENLREAVKNHSPNFPFMLGHKWHVLCPGGYFSGGAGYLLSRAALKRIVELAIDKHPACPTIDEDKEDVKMCLCGQAVGVRLLEKFGETGASLFYPYELQRYFKKQKDSKYTHDRIKNVFPYMRRDKMGFSSKHISFHYVNDTMMYITEFLLYYLNPYQPLTNSSKTI
ncbi:Glycoprotein-N-acetylgalactosamine 3-beta-galactosyltransferase [Paragonimus heterotremus]|uniref:N-acetylgalactosaminide beta-1,3-galactosyltransferase n=1 Tax=Paragonimus heterotremus TaxID=100268 RepID=A0A8J4TC14_9TREM|nr:Glycoprotein-N-acetylgalactosamine 3-beta-galactosyltransferase [Paragonimus heterotremus]